MRDPVLLSVGFTDFNRARALMLTSASYWEVCLHLRGNFLRLLVVILAQPVVFAGSGVLWCVDAALGGLGRSVVARCLSWFFRVFNSRVS